MMTHKICVVTGTRAEFGLLQPLIKKLHNSSSVNLQLVVTGSHLSRSFGNTYLEIEECGFTINHKIPIDIEGDSKTEMAVATGKAIMDFAKYFEAENPDMLIVLGDRYEIFAAATAAAFIGIPIAHIHGGEVTEGAVDEFLRHSVTKMSCLHFTACEAYRNRVIQLGEDPARVYDVGALGVENIKNMKLLDKTELTKQLQFDLKAQYAVVTYHPETLGDESEEEQLYALIRAMDSFSDMNFIITKANADAGGRLINQIWDEEGTKHPNWLVVSSLGVHKYLSAVQGASMVLGNSSSGIIEAPALQVATVNIGNRQNGRMMADSIVCCDTRTEDIVEAMTKAMSEEFIQQVKLVECPFGKGDTSQKIHDLIIRYLDAHEKMNKKTFYDIGKEVI